VTPRSIGTEVRRTEYASGLRVVTEAMPGMRSVALGVWVDVGSRDERPQVAGASHFLEHLLFKGTKTRTAQDIAEAFDAVGGDLNAFTAKEYTCYYCRVRDSDLPMAVEYMSDMLQHSVIASRDLEAERMVILEEINMRDDDPGDLIHDVFSETVWKDHPLGRAVLGSRETITSVGRDQIKRFYDRLYEPLHFVIAAAGNLSHDRLCKLVERAMDTGPRLRGRAVRPWSPGSAPVPNPETVVVRRPTEQAHLTLGTNGYSRTDPRRFAMGVMNAALGGGMSSRLFQEIREKRGLAYSVYSYHSMFAETGLFTVYAGTTPGRAQEVLGLVREQMADVAERGISDEELERGKGHLKGSLVLSLEDTSGRMSRIGRSEISHGEILTVDDVLARTDAVTADEVRSVAADVLAQPMAMAVIGPFDASAFGPDAHQVEVGGSVDALVEAAAHAPHVGAPA
jgi:predicted Zn-dependent peptidase